MISILKERNKFIRFANFFIHWANGKKPKACSVINAYCPPQLAATFSDINLFVCNPFSPPNCIPVRKSIHFWKNPSNGLRACECIPRDRTERVHSWDKQSLNKQFYKNLGIFFLIISERCILGFAYK